MAVAGRAGRFLPFGAAACAVGAAVADGGGGDVGGAVVTGGGFGAVFS